MRWRNAVWSTLRCKRFWLWQIAGAAIYSIPFLVRVFTGESELPILSLFAIPWIGHAIPPNLVEKILIQAFFPGGAGAVAGEIFISNHDGKALLGRRKYNARLFGALLWVSVWSLFQFLGNIQRIIGPYGGNLFEYPTVYPLNFAIATFAIFTPDVLGLLKKGFMKLYRKAKERAV
jgi:hypothetical protein